MTTAVAYTQEHRPMEVITPLGENVLLLNGFNGHEGISELFTFQLELLSVDASIKAEDLLGQTITVKMKEPGRFINGFVSRFSQGGQRDELVFYHVEVVPWLWHLLLTRESRIYQDLSVPDILEQVFKRQGFSDFEFALTRGYEPRTYCVQYRETHFNFVSRLMEEEGIFYFFKHEEDKHTLVVSDHHPRVSAPCLKAERVRYGQQDVDREAIYNWEHQFELRPGKYTLWDHNFENPYSNLEATLGDKFEIYEYPGGYANADAGEIVARNLIEAEECKRQTIRCESDVQGLLPCHHFTLENHYRRDCNGKYLVTQVNHFARLGSYRAWSDDASIDYQNTFSCIPDAVPFRPARRTPRPLVYGTQTALVVGPKGEEIYVDKYGRIKVQFFWDRDGKRDENSSCWVRVSTPWGGKSWGAVTLPRIDNEVLIAFEHGDPDRPYVIGSVYNADQMPPLDLPGSGIEMGMKSRSSPGGGGYNQITMNDTKGTEKLTIHGQYDMATTVQNDQTNTVNNNRTTTIAVDDTESVGSNQSISVSANQSTSVGGDQSLSVSGKQTVDVGGDASKSVGGNDSLSVSGNRSASVSGTDEMKVSGDQTITVSGGQSITISGAGVLHADANQEVSASADVIIDGGANVTITGGASIKLTCGGSTIEIGPGSITIQSAGVVAVQGATVKLN